MPVPVQVHKNTQKKTAHLSVCLPVCPSSRPSVSLCHTVTTFKKGAGQYTSALIVDVSVTTDPDSTPLVINSTNLAWPPGLFRSILSDFFDLPLPM